MEILNYVEISKLLHNRNQGIDFDGKETLKSLFENINKLIENLEEHRIITSTIKRMVEYAYHIKKYSGTFFNNVLEQWAVKEGNEKTWKAFKSHFAVAKKKQHLTIKVMENNDKSTTHHAAYNDTMQEEFTTAFNWVVH